MTKICVKCGSIEFYPNGNCKPCRKKTLAKYRLNNVEKLKAAMVRYLADNPRDHKKYYAEHKDACLARQKKWVNNNKESIKAYRTEWNAANQDYISKYNASRSERMKKYRAENPSSSRIHRLNRRARKKKNGGILSIGLADKLFKLQKGKCPCCGKPLGNDYHMDHRMPLALGGANEDSNMQLLTATCNLQKHAKHPIDFMQSRGFLI